MPRLIKATPKYRKHRASGQAVVRVQGHDFFLGPHGTKASLAEYDRIICEWLANGRRLPTRQQDEGLTVAEVLNEYRKYAIVYYGNTGHRRGTFNDQKPVLRSGQAVHCGMQEAANTSKLGVCPRKIDRPATPPRTFKFSRKSRLTFIPLRSTLSSVLLSGINV